MPCYMLSLTIMRLYKREDFIKLPEKTIYSRIDNNISELCYGLFCKTSNREYGNDWVEQDLIGECDAPEELTSGTDIVNYALKNRDEFSYFETDLDCGGRDGMFNDKDVFVVWDKKDIKKLYDYLGDCI